jgi:hypothetical protein
MAKTSEFKKFDDAVKTILKVSKPELKKREEEWQQNKASKKKRDRSDPASPGLAAERPVSG